MSGVQEYTVGLCTLSVLNVCGRCYGLREVGSLFFVVIGNPWKLFCKQ